MRSAPPSTGWSAGRGSRRRAGGEEIARGRVAGVDQLLGPGEVERSAAVGDSRKERDAGICSVTLLVAPRPPLTSDGERAQDDLDGRPGELYLQVSRRFADVDLVDGAGDGMGHGHVVDDATVDEQAAVVLDRGVEAWQSAACEQSGLERARGEYGFRAARQISGDDAERHGQLGELGNAEGVDHRGQAFVAPQVVGPAGE